MKSVSRAISIPFGLHNTSVYCCYISLIDGQALEVDSGNFWFICLKVAYSEPVYKDHPKESVFSTCLMRNHFQGVQKMWSGLCRQVVVKPGLNAIMFITHRVLLRIIKKDGFWSIWTLICELPHSIFSYWEEHHTSYFIWKRLPMNFLHVHVSRNTHVPQNFEQKFNVTFTFGPISLVVPYVHICVLVFALHVITSRIKFIVKNHSYDSKTSSYTIHLMRIWTRCILSFQCHLPV